MILLHCFNSHFNELKISGNQVTYFFNLNQQYFLQCKHRWPVWKEMPASNGAEEIFCDDGRKQQSLLKFCLMEDLPDHKHTQLRTNPLLHSNGELC